MLIVDSPPVRGRKQACEQRSLCSFFVYILVVNGIAFAFVIASGCYASPVSLSCLSCVPLVSNVHTFNVLNTWFSVTTVHRARSCCVFSGNSVTLSFALFPSVWERIYECVLRFPRLALLRLPIQSCLSPFLLGTLSVGEKFAIFSNKVFRCRSSLSFSSCQFSGDDGIRGIRESTHGA